MNAKKSKALRKMLRNWGGMSEESANLPQHRLVEDTNRATTVVVTREELEAAGVNPEEYEVSNRGTVASSPMLKTTMDNEGKVMTTTMPETEIKSVYKVKIKTGPVRNDTQSKRGLYLHFKEELTKLENKRKQS